jgi:AhpD family alkylhydroperoxidase
MQNPVMIVPGALPAALALGEALKQCGLPETTLAMIHLRASQINGCSYCVDMAARDLRTRGESDERVAAVAAWRDAPWFDDAERAALALTESATRLSDRSDPVPDAVWADVTRHLDERAMAGVLLQVGMTTFWNHVNVPIRQGPAAGARAGAH